MLTQTDMDDLRNSLIAMRDRMKVGHVHEDEIWSLVCRAEEAMDTGRGTEFAENAKVIYSLLLAVWNNARERESLMRHLQ